MQLVKAYSNCNYAYFLTVRDGKGNKDVTNEINLPIRFLDDDELIEYNIKVNILNPGRANTPLRKRIFGKEDPKSLLKPEKVANKIYDILFTDITGSVFDIN